MGEEDWLTFVKRTTILLEATENCNKKSFQLLNTLSCLLQNDL